MQHTTLSAQTALITGAARRIGAAIARRLHAVGMNLSLHYRHSHREAETLAAELNQKRPNSVHLIQADLLINAELPHLIEATVAHWGSLDVLINNASSFYPTPLADARETDWDDLIGSNLKAPFFLAQAAAPHLLARNGCIINIVDIHGERPRDGYPIYSIAKAGLIMLTKALALELRPTVRVNAVAPGAILWATSETDPAAQSETLKRVPMRQLGDPADIADTVLFLIRDGGYINGQIIAVDGGRTLSM